VSIVRCRANKSAPAPPASTQDKNQRPCELDGSKLAKRCVRTPLHVVSSVIAANGNVVCACEVQALTDRLRHLNRSAQRAWGNYTERKAGGRSRRLKKAELRSAACQETNWFSA
jgi:hypothetical protein